MNKKKKEQILVGKPLIPNAGVRTWYTKELNDLVAQMDERTRREVLEIFRTVAVKKPQNSHNNTGTVRDYLS